MMLGLYSPSSGALRIFLLTTGIETRPLGGWLNKKTYLLDRLETLQFIMKNFPENGFSAHAEAVL
jgi:hypothetical protein